MTDDYCGGGVGIHILTGATGAAAVAAKSSRDQSAPTPNEATSHLSSRVDKESGVASYGLAHVPHSHVAPAMSHVGKYRRRWRDAKGRWGRGALCNWSKQRSAFRARTLV